MQIYRFAAHFFDNLGSLQFSKEDYSKFKHGSRRISQLFGRELAVAFLTSDLYQEKLSPVFDKEIVVCSAPYKYIPVASTHLKDDFIACFNQEWSKEKAAVVDLKVFRKHSYNDDYGSLTKEQRNTAIFSDDFHIDKEFIRNKTLIFIDDIRITGAHEQRMLALLQKNDFVGEVFFLYFAQLNEHPLIHPNIENELNYAFVKQLSDIQFIIEKEEFAFNTRVVKFMLKADFPSFQHFIHQQNTSFQQSLLAYLQGNDYHKIPEFEENVRCLSTILTKNLLKRY